MYNSFTFQTLNLQEIDHSIVTLYEITDKPTDVPKFASLYVIMAYQSINVYRHLFSISEGTWPRRGYIEIVDIISWATEVLLKLLVSESQLHVREEAWLIEFCKVKGKAIRV